MSFEDQIDTYRAIAENEAEEKRARKAKRLEEINALPANEYTARALMDDLHWRISMPGKPQVYMDYWPSTGRWATFGPGYGAKRRGRIDDSLALLDHLHARLPS